MNIIIFLISFFIAYIVMNIIYFYYTINNMRSELMKLNTEIFKLKIELNEVQYDLKKLTENTKQGGRKNV